nr:phytase [Pontibacter ruber]
MATTQVSIESVDPEIVTDKVEHDTDDPAIWINPEDPSESLILGTDKDSDGALYVFDLKGNIIEDKVVDDLERPNNVDVEYGLKLEGRPVDIAVVTERYTRKLRIYSLPDMKPIDNGGIAVFKGESGSGYRDPMGISLYKSPNSGSIYVVVGRKDGPTNGTYLWQYLLEDDGDGEVKATLVRKFGDFSGKQEIESIAVDDELGYVYYSDEGIGVRKYHAEPSRGNKQLALFANDDFEQDQEGISIYKVDKNTGYILVSDQQNNRFHIFPREGDNGDPHEHELIKIVKVEADDSDGSEITNVPLNDTFRSGLFVAMSTNRTFHYYSWNDIAGDDLQKAVY